MASVAKGPRNVGCHKSDLSKTAKKVRKVFIM